MKILSVIDSLLHGGAETILVNIINGLPQHQHMVVHFSRYWGETASEFLLEKLININVPVIDANYHAFSDKKFQDQILEIFPAEVVLYHWWKNDPLSAWRQSLEKNAARPKFICVIHKANPTVHVQEGYDFYVSVSGFINRFYKKIPEDKKIIIYNGIDTQRFGVCQRPLKNKKFVIGRVSSLKKGKIPQDWIKQAGLFNIPDSHFIIAGEGPLKKELSKDVSDYGLENRFFLPGHIHPNDLPDLLGTFDICCYITDSELGEAHSLSLLECAAAGLPIISQPRGGIPEQVVHGKTGFLSEDINEIRDYCLLLSKDDHLRTHMSRESRNFGLKFNIIRMANAYNTLFQSMSRL